MKTWFWMVLASLLLAGGCATSTIEKRKKERYGSYAALPEAMRGAVDKGQIKVGMTMDAVYIAWGKPAQVLTSETPQGTVVTWLYHGSQLHEYHYWAYHHYIYHGYYGGHPWLQTGYYPVQYVSAEVEFEKGVVGRWHTLPAPPTY